MSYLGNLLFILIGYLFGSISFSIILAKLIHQENIKEKGSGNAGATNSTRSYGFREGFIVFLLDTAKVVLPTVICWILISYSSFMDWSNSYISIAAFSAFIGHIFPIWHKFKGGKGVSCFFGFCLSMNIVLAIIVVIVFWLIVSVWKMVSLSSVTMPAIIFCFSWIPWFQTGQLTFFMANDPWWLASFLILVMEAIIVLKHIPNIKKILHEQESTISQILKK